MGHRVNSHRAGRLRRLITDTTHISESRLVAVWELALPVLFGM